MRGLPERSKVLFIVIHEQHIFHQSPFIGQNPA
jgi:hypothetical protein